MADKEKGKEQDEEEKVKELTPEERIAKLEKGRKLSLILIIVLAVFSVAQTAGLVVALLFSGDDALPKANSEALAALESRISTMQDATKTIEAFNLKATVLDEKLDRVLSETDLNNFATLRTLLQKQEESYGAFIKALQQGMFDLSRMVRGSRTWYDVYKEDLDRVLNGSKERLMELQGMAPAKNK